MSAPRVVAKEHLESACRRAFGRPPEETFVKRPGGTVRIDGYTLLALPVPEPMVEKVDEMAAEIRELRMQVAFREHRAYVIVSCQGRPPSSSREEAYGYVGRFAAALIDETTTLVYSPELIRGSLTNEETVEGLRSGDPLSALRSVTFDAIGLVPREDPRMVAAVAEARRRLPEFVEAVRSGDDLGLCLVKGPFTDGTNTEFMWVAPTAIVGEAIRGILANEPFRVRGLRKGATVEIAFGDVADWFYPGEDGMVGPFTEGIVNEKV